MSKKFLLGLAVIAIVGVSTTTSWAQCNQSLGATSTYQRFSYAPTAVVPPSLPVMAAPSYRPMVAQTPMVQSYRRFSYQPSAGTHTMHSANKAQWEYAKADPRRYNH